MEEQNGKCCEANGLITFPPVLSKADFVNRYKVGEFGNASPTWDNLEDWFKDCCTNMGSIKVGEDSQLYHVRSRVKGAPTFYDLKWGGVLSTWKQINGGEYYISAMAPTAKTLVQGEVCQVSHNDLYKPGVVGLHYTTVAKPMREALAECSYQIYGIEALSILRKYMNAKSLDWLNELLNRYEHHVVEFSVYSVKWGTLPGYNTVFWEVRNY